MRTPPVPISRFERYAILLCRVLPQKTELYNGVAIISDGANTRTPTWRGKTIGISLCLDDNRVSVIHGHPYTQFWLSRLEPAWRAERAQQCPLCHGTGWDGETYTLSCHACGGSGNPTPSRLLPA